MQKFRIFLLILCVYFVAHFLFNLIVDLKWMPPSPLQIDPEGISRKKHPDGSLILSDDFLQDSILAKAFLQKSQQKNKKNNLFNSKNDKLIGKLPNVEKIEVPSKFIMVVFLKINFIIQRRKKDFKHV